MANRFYTILIVPEKTSKVRKLVVPGWMMRGAAVGFAFTVLLALVMIFDYWFVMGQIGENKQLKLENRRLRQQVQVFKNRITTVESSLERIKNFATRLKVITNIGAESSDSMVQSVNKIKIPEANAPYTPETWLAASPVEHREGKLPLATSETETKLAELSSASTQTQGPERAPEQALFPVDPDEIALRKEYETLELRMNDFHREALYVEQVLQDEYEMLADKKTFLAAQPVRKPARGYFTSGFGVRHSPFFPDRVKMHEGLDIANARGTEIRAPADGVVTFADVKSGYGRTLILDHGYGLETWYAHTNEFKVHRGEKVRRGKKIATIGNSGRSTGPHLHYEVRVHGVPVDPRNFLTDDFD